MGRVFVGMTLANAMAVTSGDGYYLSSPEQASIKNFVQHTPEAALILETLSGTSTEPESQKQIK